MRVTNKKVIYLFKFQVMIATIILICLASGRFLIDAVNHGQEKISSKYNIITGLFVMSVQFTLFYYAGLFDKF